MAPNPDLYARMAVPYDTAEAAQAALKAFLKDVAGLREKHRIAEVAMIAGAYVGGEMVGMTQTLGDQRRVVTTTRSLYQQALLNEAGYREEEAKELRRMAGEVE